MAGACRQRRPRHRGFRARRRPPSVPAVYSLGPWCVPLLLAKAHEQDKQHYHYYEEEEDAPKGWTRQFMRSLATHGFRHDVPFGVDEGSVKTDRPLKCVLPIVVMGMVVRVIALFWHRGVDL